MDENFTYGGPLTVALNQCRELRRLGHDVTIVGGWLGNREPPQKVEDVPCNLFKLKRLTGHRFSGLYSGELRRWVIREAHTVDVFHLHFARDLATLSVAWSLRRLNVPYLTQTHGMVVPDRRPIVQILDSLSTRRLLNSAKAVLVLNETEQEQLKRVCGKLSPTTLQNGVPVTAIAEKRAESNPLEIVFLGRLHPRKRVLHFARAAANVWAENGETRFRVFGPDDGDLTNLQRLMESVPALKECLSYCGPVTHSQAMVRLQDSSIFVMPSIDEPFPMTLLEALSIGVPSICTTSCGIADALHERGAALVVEPTVDALTSAISRLARSPELRDALSRKGRQIVTEKYSMTRIARELVDIYGKALEMGASP